MVTVSMVTMISSASVLGVKMCVKKMRECDISFSSSNFPLQLFSISYCSDTSYNQ